MLTPSPFTCTPQRWQKQLAEATKDLTLVRAAKETAEALVADLQAQVKREAATAAERDAKITQLEMDLAAGKSALAAATARGKADSDHLDEMRRREIEGESRARKDRDEIERLTKLLTDAGAAADERDALAAKVRALSRPLSRPLSHFYLAPI